MATAVFIVIADEDTTGKFVMNPHQGFVLVEEKLSAEEIVKRVRRVLSIAPVPAGGSQYD